MSSSNALNDFFVSVQARAFRQVEIAVKNREDSLDILQDAMVKLATKYSDKSDSWGPLFQRILQNCMHDYFRKQKLRRMFRLGFVDDESFQTNEQVQEQHDTSKSDHSYNHVLLSSVENALRELPERQRQAFILRAWWEYDTSETAYIMGCSSGSVKTHYSRAQQRIKMLMRQDDDR
jgi:RNA polymerase sigma-70 factor (ECF subfamily)